MHYMGMAAMRMPAALSYSAIWVATSILIAIGASSVALWLAFKNSDLRRKFVAAAAMGIAISGMHYTAMEGAAFTASPAVQEEAARSSLDQSTLALGVTMITFIILSLALAASLVDRRLADLLEARNRAVARSEEEFRALYRRTPMPLHALDEDGIVREVSDAWLELVGYERRSVVGRPLSDFMSPDAAERFQETDWPRLRRVGTLVDVEYRFVSRRAGFVDVLFSARVDFGDASRSFWATGGIVDVTARRQTEEALRQAQKMEAIGRLTGGLAHDFNNLLTVILGSLNNLAKHLPSDPRMHQLLNGAVEGAERGAVLTQRMLAFARKQTLAPGVVDLAGLIGGMTDFLRRTIGPEIRIETRFPSTPVRVVADFEPTRTRSPEPGGQRARRDAGGGHDQYRCARGDEGRVQQA